MRCSAWQWCLDANKEESKRLIEELPWPSKYVKMAHWSAVLTIKIGNPDHWGVVLTSRKRRNGSGSFQAALRLSLWHHTRVLFRGLADRAPHPRIIENRSTIYNCLIRHWISCTKYATGARLANSAWTIAFGTHLHSSPKPPRAPTHAFIRPCCTHPSSHVVLAWCARSAGCQPFRGRRLHLHQRGARLISLPLSDSPGVFLRCARQLRRLLCPSDAHERHKAMWEGAVVP